MLLSSAPCTSVIITIMRKTEAMMMERMRNISEGIDKASRSSRSEEEAE